MKRELHREPSDAELELAAQRRKLRALQRVFAESELALGEVRDQLMSFEGRYIRQVGRLYKELDEWHRKREALHKKPGSEEDFSDIADEPLEAERVQIAQTIRSLFREVAKRLHPDFASDAADEVRRTRLMAQANDAARRGDRAALERMLRGFELPFAANSAEAMVAELAYLKAQTEELANSIAKADAEREKLTHSEMAALQRQCIAAALEGRDQLAEMAVRVKGLIGIAMRQYELDLDRIKRPPRGAMAESLLTAETATTFRFVNGKRQNR